MGERHTNESRLQVTLVISRPPCDRLEPSEWIRFVSAEQPEMVNRPGGV
jgi:hypothetical protein